MDIEWELKKLVLEEIKLLTDELLTTKHGSKVLTKLRAGYPAIFGPVPATTTSPLSETKKI